MKLFIPLLAGFFMLSACAVEWTPEKTAATEEAARAYVAVRWPDFTPGDALGIPEEDKPLWAARCALAGVFVTPEGAPYLNAVCEAIQES